MPTGLPERLARPITVAEIADWPRYTDVEPRLVISEVLDETGAGRRDARFNR